MASRFLTLNSSCASRVSLNRVAIMKWRAIKQIKCLQKTSNPELIITRKSAHYLPSICDHGFIQSIKSAYEDVATVEQRIETLKDYTRGLLEKEVDPIVELELIATLERLGVGYLFGVEIKRALEGFVLDTSSEGDLHCTALYFRLLRQNGHMILQDVFSRFMDENGRFREDLCEDTEGIMSLYEASFLALEGESVMDDARAFTTKHLNQYLSKGSNSRLHQRVEHALAIPFHWMPPRLDARWFIDAYARYEKKDPFLLELAKLDYNMCLAAAQDNVKYLSRWWKNLGVAESLNFTRDRLPESFILGLGTVFKRKYGSAIEGVTQASQFVVSMDDLFEHYGNIEELKLFADAVERWDVNAVEELPDCMRLCYLALLNTYNHYAYDTLRLKGIYIIPLLKKIWMDQFKSVLTEIKWSSQGYTPKFDEYLDNARITLGGFVVLVTAYFLMHQEVSYHTVDLIATNHDLIELSSTIFRLCDDIGEAMDDPDGRDVPSSVHYYMWERGVTYEAALEGVRHVLSESWKKINKHLVLGSHFHKDFVDAALGFARIAHWLYLTGDGFRTQRLRTMDTFKLLVIDPIPDN